VKLNKSLFLETTNLIDPNSTWIINGWLLTKLTCLIWIRYPRWQTLQESI